MTEAQELLNKRIAELTVKSQDGTISESEYTELGKSLMQAEGELIKAYKNYGKKDGEGKEDYSKRMMKMGYHKKAKGEDDDKYSGRMKYMKAQGYMNGDGGKDDDEEEKKSTKSEPASRESLIKSAHEYLAERRKKIERSSEMEEELEKAQKQLQEYEIMLKGYEDNDLLTTVQKSLSALFDVIKSQGKDIEVLKSVIAEKTVGEDVMTKSHDETVEIFGKIENVMKSLDQRLDTIEKQPAASDSGVPAGGLTKSQLKDRFSTMIDNRFDEGEKGGDLTKSLLSAPKGLIGKILLKGATEGKIDGRLVTKFELASGNPLSLPAAAQQFVASELPKWQVAGSSA